MDSALTAKTDGALQDMRGAFDALQGAVMEAVVAAKDGQGPSNLIARAVANNLRVTAGLLKEGAEATPGEPEPRPTDELAELIKYREMARQHELAQEPVDMPRVTRLTASIEALKAHPEWMLWHGVRANDRSTWPPELLKYAEPIRFDLEAADHMGHYRENVLTRLALERTGDVYPFLKAAIAYLNHQVDFDTPAGRLLDEMGSWLFGLAQEMASHCLDLVPVIDEVMPFETGEELLAVVRAAIAGEEDDDTGQQEDDAAA